MLRASFGKCARHYLRIRNFRAIAKSFCKSVVRRNFRCNCDARLDLRVWPPSCPKTFRNVEPVKDLSDPANPPCLLAIWKTSLDDVQPAATFTHQLAAQRLSFFCKRRLSL